MTLQLGKKCKRKHRTTRGAPLLRYRKQTMPTESDLQGAQWLILYISLLTALLKEQLRREKKKNKSFWPLLTTITFSTKLTKTNFTNEGVLIL
jgi:hypothetical protein